VTVTHDENAVGLAKHNKCKR